MVYGDDGDNNGENLILLLLFLGDTYLSCTLKLFEENEMLYIFFFFSLKWVSHTPNSTVTHLSIFTSCLTFFRGFGHLPLFISSYPLFFRALISLNNITSGSNQDNLSIYFTGKQKCFWLFSPGLGVEYFWVALEMEMSGYMWMCTSGVEVECMSERASET